MLERLVRVLATDVGGADEKDVSELGAIMAAALDNLAPNLTAMAPAADCQLRGTSAGTLSQLLSRVAGGAIFVQARIEKPAGFVIVRIGLSTIDWWLAATIGGPSGGSASGNRAITMIEQRVGRIIIDLVLASLASALSQRAIAASFHECKAVTSVDDLPKVSDDPSALSVMVDLSREQGAAEVEIIVPKRLALDWCGRAVAHNESRESATQGESEDKEWSGQLEAQVATTRVQIDAVLNQASAELGWIATWAAGMTIPIDATTATPIMLETDGLPLLECRLGKFGSSMSVQIEAAAGEVIDGLGIEAELRGLREVIGPGRADVNQMAGQERLNGTN